MKSYPILVSTGNNSEILDFLADPQEYVIGFLRGDDSRKYTNVEKLIRQPTETRPKAASGHGKDITKIDAQNDLIDDVASRFLHGDVKNGNGLADRMTDLRKKWAEAVETETTATNNTPVAAPERPQIPVMPNIPANPNAQQSRQLQLYNAQVQNYELQLQNYQYLKRDLAPQVLLTNVLQRFKENFCRDISAHETHFFTWAIKVYQNYTGVTNSDILNDTKHPAIFPSDNLVHRYKKAARFFAFTRQVADMDVPGDVLETIHPVSLKQQYEKIRVRLPGEIRKDANTLPDDPGNTEAEVLENIKLLEKVCHTRTQSKSTTQINIMCFEEIEAERTCKPVPNTKIMHVGSQNNGYYGNNANNNTNPRGQNGNTKNPKNGKSRGKFERCFKCTKDETNPVTLCVHLCVQCQNLSSTKRQDTPCAHRKPLFEKFSERKREKAKRKKEKEAEADFQNARQRV